MPAKALICFAIGVSVFGQTYSVQTLAGHPFQASGAAKSAVLGMIGGVAVDSSGSLYIALHTSHMVVKLDSAGNMTRVAGTGVYGFGGDGGPATSAQIAFPQGLAFDKSGNLYIQDGGNQRVRMVSGGTISSVPGTEGLLGVTQGIYFAQTTGLNALPGFSSMTLISGLAVNSKGTLYVSDTINHRVFSVSGGKATVAAGTGVAGYSGDGAVATSSQLNQPFGIAIDSADNVYIADTRNSRVRMIKASNGFIYTMAGSGSPGFAGDGSDAGSSTLNLPIGVAVDSSDNLYIADSANYRIRIVWKAAQQVVINGVQTTIRPNTIQTIAGYGTSGVAPVADGTSVTAALLGVCAALAVDSSGNIYFTDVDHRRVLTFTTAGGVITNVAGAGTSNGDGGSPVNAQLVVPLDVTADAAGNVYSLDLSRFGVRKIANGVIGTVAGNGLFDNAGDYGAAASARLAAVGIASDASGNLFLASAGSYLVKPDGGRIREVTGGLMYKVAGSGQLGFTGDGSLAVGAQLNVPAGVAVDGAGNFYIADTNNYRVRQVSASTKLISTFAGDGNNLYGGDGNAATSAQIGRPTRIAADASGNLYIADFEHSVIRRVDAATGKIATVAGTGTAGYSGDGGPSNKAQIDRPTALATDASGNLYYFDAGKSVVRRIENGNGVISTVAGSGIRGYGGDNGPARGANLGWTWGMAVDRTGRIYLADTDSSVIRMLVPSSAPCTYTVNPLSAQVSASGETISIGITTSANCPWSVTSLPDWITVSGSSTGTGAGSVSLVVAANTGEAREAGFSVAGSTVSISQTAAACAYVVSPTGQFFAAAGGTGTIQVSTRAGCSWTITGTPSWVSLTAATNGTGSGTAAYQVAANAGGARQATLSVSGSSYTIEQSSGIVSGLTASGTLAHFAAMGGWKTIFTLVNTGSTSATAQLDFTQDDGSAIVLPLSLPQSNQTGMSGSSIQKTLGAGAVLPVVSAGSGAQELQGRARLLSTGNVGGFSVFEYQGSGDSVQEAVVPLETRNAASYWLAFDNTNGYSTGLAVSNTSAQAVDVQVVVRNGAGAAVASHKLSLQPGGHSAFSMTQQYPETAGLLGTLQFITPAAGQITVLGIRVNPQGAFTSVPALVATSGATASIPHFASGGGWKTTFTLVNTGTAAAPITLGFFDDNGSPQPIPLSFPQGGASAVTTASFQQTLAAGATLVIESQGPLDQVSISGSAQLQTTGSVTGSAVFQYLGHQEAVVPAEDRSGQSYVLPFDNTGGYFYGLALANRSSQPATVAVTTRDAVTGKVTGSHSLTLQANGHTQFLLSDTLLGFSETLNTSGTLEFKSTAAGQLGVLGLRFNPNAAFTSVPALLKQ